MRAGGFAYLSGFLIFCYCSFLDKANIEKFERILWKSLISLIIFVVVLNINRISKEFKTYNTKDFFYFTNQYNAYNNKFSNDYFNNFLKNKKNFVKKNNYIFILTKF